jgi:acyl transferase domain-containing protein
VECESEVPIFSAAEYQPLRMESEPIAESFAKMLTSPVDFPRLVEQAYRGGSRVFIELGAGSNCAKWISAVLKDKPHLSVSINQVNVSDHQSILRMLARLISHHIPLNLEPLGAG